MNGTFGIPFLSRPLARTPRTRDLTGLGYRRGQVTILANRGRTRDGFAGSSWKPPIESAQRTIENSPAIYRWDLIGNTHGVREADG